MMILIRNVRRGPRHCLFKIAHTRDFYKTVTVKFKTGHCQYHDLRTELIACTTRAPVAECQSSFPPPSAAHTGSFEQIRV